MHKSLRVTAAALAAGLVLIACGTPADTESGGTPVSDAGSAPVTEPAITPAATADTGDTAPEDAVVVDPSTPAEVAQASSVASDPSPDVEVAATEAPPQTEAPGPAEAVLGGRAFASELAAESDFAENILPDLQVDDIRSGQKVNIRNVFPAERPVLMWMWAPH